MQLPVPLLTQHCLRQALLKPFEHSSLKSMHYSQELFNMVRLHANSILNPKS